MVLTTVVIITITKLITKVWCWQGPIISVLDNNRGSETVRQARPGVDRNTEQRGLHIMRHICVNNKMQSTLHTAASSNRPGMSEWQSHYAAHLPAVLQWQPQTDGLNAVSFINKCHCCAGRERREDWKNCLLNHPSLWLHSTQPLCGLILKT